MSRHAGRRGPARGAADDRHDYRQCFYNSQPDRASVAAQDCPRFPCRVFREE